MTMKKLSSMRFGSLPVIALATSTLLACGTTLPPSELVTARESYARASHGPAAQFKPDELHEAKDALDTAESSFSNNGASPETKDLAYAAGLKSEEAEADARTTIAQKEKEDTLKKAQSQTLDTMRRAKSELAQTKQELASERQKREEAERKAAQAMADLQKIAAVKQESRGMVITLSGEVLFPSGQSSLLPGAMVKLNDVADALTKSSPESKIVVEGHTDAQGKADFNQELSLKRAQSVRDYLVSRGIAGDRVSAQGMGSTRPIASNANPEGRANNRRVEIVVQPAPGGASGG
jgi:outer membrane protein OmpA-like peptidoglycan-associated protein